MGQIESGSWTSKSVVYPSEADLEKLGVTEVGTRKRLLAGQHNIHLRPWDKSSMPAIDIENMQTNLRLDAILLIYCNLFPSTALLRFTILGWKGIIK